MKYAKAILFSEIPFLIAGFIMFGLIVGTALFVDLPLPEIMQ